MSSFDTTDQLLKPSEDPTGYLRRKYRLAVLLLASLILVSQLVIQRSISRQAHDAEVVNVAGRQRMLSQRLCKAALALEAASDPAGRVTRIKEIADTLAQWKAAQTSLQSGGKVLRAAPENSPATLTLFASITPHFESMVKSAEGIIAADATERDAGKFQARIAPFVTELLQSEGHFIEGMERIVFVYASEAEGRVGRHHLVELALTMLVLAVLLAEGLLIFRPAINRMALEFQRRRHVELNLRQQSVELEKALGEAQAGVRAKAEFLATMSHEIRTPLNGVIGMTSLILGTKLDTEQREYAQSIGQCSESLLAVINDILDFSKIEAGKLDLERTDFDPNRVLEDVADICAFSAQEKGLDLIIHQPQPFDRQLLGDPGRLRQVLLNLTNNAIKFTPRGEVLVSLSADRDPATNILTLQFDVSDTGIGIPASRMDRLFKSFSQVDSSDTRRFGGTGLGLAISRRLVELMGGTITVRSAEGKGSTFTVRLPFGEGATMPKAMPEPVVPLDGRRVIVIDDNATNRRVLREMLRRWGCIAEETDSGRAGVALMQQAMAAGQPFDLLLLDFQMPELSGGDTARLVRANESIAATPILLLSSVASRRELNAEWKPFVDAALLKPIKMNALRVAMEDVLREGARRTAEIQQRSAPKPAPRRPDGTPYRVLFAEDNIVNQRIGEAFLRRLGLECAVAADGHEALSRLAEGGFDLVLMDVQMPGMNGLEATRAIRELERDGRPHIPVIAVTADALQGDRERGLAAGMDDYLTKPFNDAAFQAIIAKFLSLAARPATPAAVPKSGPLKGVETQGLELAAVAEASRSLKAMRKHLEAGDFVRMKREVNVVKMALGECALPECKEPTARLEAAIVGEQQQDAQTALTALEEALKRAG